MFRNMVTSLFKHDQIRTTDAKAKELRRWADQLVTLAKRGDLHARRQAMAIIQEKDVVHKLFEEAPKRFADVNGGYTRVVKIGFRPGDAAPESLVQLVTPEPKKKKKPRRKKKAAPAAASTVVKETTAVETEKVATPEAPVESAASEKTVDGGAVDAQAEEGEAEVEAQVDEKVQAKIDEDAVPEGETPPSPEEPDSGETKEEK
jgi:large subunit ribosomal protein L17